MRFLSSCLLLFVAVCTPSFATEEAKYLLAAELADGDATEVKVTLEVGGDKLIIDEASGAVKKSPLTVAAELQYVEQLLAWSSSSSESDSSEVTRSWREYQSATAKIQVEEEGGIERELPRAKRLIVAEIRDGLVVLNGAKMPLTRDQFDLVNVVGNSLLLNRLLPGREVAEGDGWDHDASTIGPLLGMDHVAVCEVRSIVTGSEHRQVQIRLAGTVHGTIDGAPTEIELRGAYLFHEQYKRVTKFNLAIKEARTASPIVPGLDIVAKVSLTISPVKTAQTTNITARARDTSKPLATALSYEAPQRGYRFLHGRAWYIMSEQSDLVSLRSLQDGNQTSHCNVTTLPARSAGRETTLEQFERDVRQSLGDNLETVTASTRWITEQGHNCLGVVAQGKVEDVPIEWRYYLVASPDLPRISIAVTMKQSIVEQFNNADRQIVDSLELFATPATAQKQAKQTKR